MGELVESNLEITLRPSTRNEIGGDMKQLDNRSTKLFKFDRRLKKYEATRSLICKSVSRDPNSSSKLSYERKKPFHEVRRLLQLCMTQMRASVAKISPGFGNEILLVSVNEEDMVVDVAIARADSIGMPSFMFLVIASTNTKICCSLQSGIVSITRLNNALSTTSFRSTKE